MLEKVEIRRVRRSDLDQCFDLEMECYAPEEQVTRDFMSKRIEVYPYGFLVAVIDDKVVGMINSGATHKEDITDESFKKMIGHVRNGCNSVVFSLAVTHQYRNKGIAGKLLHKLKRLAADSGKRKMLLLCKEEHIEMYRKSGFEYSQVSQFSWAGVIWHEMILPLNPQRNDEVVAFGSTDWSVGHLMEGGSTCNSNVL